MNISKEHKWQHAKRHAQHDPNVNHKNKNIDASRTHLNKNFTYASADDLLEKHWKDYIDDHDQKVVARRDKKKQYKTAKNYFNQKGKKLDTTLVGTVGNIDEWNEVTKMITDKCGDTPATEQRIADAFNHGVTLYCQSFNAKYDSFQITEAVTNQDEAGAPHYHAQMVNLGTTKKGKPSASFDRALLQATGNTDSRTRLATFRADNDDMLVTAVGHAFSQEFGKEFPDWTTGKMGSAFTLYRKHASSVGVDHDVYVETKEEATKDAKKENKQLASKNKQLKQENDDLTPKIKAKSSKLADLTAETEKYQDVLDNIKDATAEAFNEEYGAQVAQLQQKQQEQDERQKEQDEREQQLNERYERVEDMKTTAYEVNHETVKFVADQIGTLSNLDDDDAFMVASGDAGLDDYGLSDKHLTGMGASLKLYSEAQHSGKMKALRKRNDFTKQQAHKKQQSNDFEL